MARVSGEAAYRASGEADDDDEAVEIVAVDQRPPRYDRPSIRSIN